MNQDLSKLSDDEFERALAQSRKGLPRRLALAGVLVVLGGIAVTGVGTLVRELQEGAVIVFMAPIQWQLGGIFIVGVGALFLVIAAFLACWARVAAEPPVPRATARRRGDPAKPA